MSKALNSPTGRLLRSSRLFSLPPPLPDPSVQAITSAGILRSSDTATLPYPTRQAIATPKSSRHRGDWGLKRPLPQRSTSTSTPHLRINALDTREHITHFESAADHTLNLAKWQEMDIVMLTTPAPNATGQVYGTDDRKVSVFEDELDNTASREARKPLSQMNESTEFESDYTSTGTGGIPEDPAQERRRWKVGGPWLPGMSEDEFQSFLMKQVAKPEAKRRFLSFMRRVRSERRMADVTADLREEGGIAEDDELEIEKAGQIDDAELATYIKQLRDEWQSLSSDLSGFIQEFFDFPRFVPRGDDLGGLKRNIADLVPGSERPPPATHPSAGLSYLRSKAYLHNHPNYGPQVHSPPVEARVLRPRSMVTGSSERAKLGIGGFVVEDDKPRAFQSQGGPVREEEIETGDVSAEKSTAYLIPQLVGGNKVWVTPRTAHVDEAGKVRLQHEVPDKTAIAIQRGTFDYDTWEARRQQAIKDPHDRRTQNLATSGAPATRPAFRGPEYALPGKGSDAFDQAAAKGRREVEAGRMDQNEMVQQLLRQHQQDTQER